MTLTSGPTQISCILTICVTQSLPLLWAIMYLFGIGWKELFDTILETQSKMGGQYLEDTSVNS
jgi:hypothetical protein